MKSEDLFEALTDIDDDLIYKAKAAQLKDTKTDEDYAEPTFITVTKRKFPWKAAACAAVAVIAAFSAGAAVLQNGNIALPSQQGGMGGEDIALKTAEYPPEAKYVYDGDFFELTLEIAGEADRKGYDLYDPMERDSDLVVYGTFTDDAHQIFDPEIARDVFNPSENLYSYNKFRIDKVIKSDGNIKEGDEIIIAQDYAVYGSQLMTTSGLTPMIKGDKWFYCLTKSGDSSTYYYATGDTDGRYSSFDSPPQHDYTRSFDSPGIFDNNDYKKNIHELVYERYLNENFIPDVSHLVNYLDETSVDMFDTTKAFEIPEFPGVYFVWSAYELRAVKDGAEEVLYSGMPIWDLHLADLNGDGKREICSTVSIGSGIIDDRIIAADYANNEVYELSDRGNYDYRISVELTEDQNKSHEQQALFYSRERYNGYGLTVSESEGGILALDIMKKIAAVVIDGGNIDASAYEFPAEGAVAAENTSLEQACTSGEESENRAALEDFKEYEQFGMTYVSEKKGLFYNGKQVRWFEDYYPVDEDGNQAGIDYINEIGVVDVYAVRDFSNLTRNPDGSFDPGGKLIGLKEFSEEEFADRDIKAILENQQVTHIAYAYDDSTAVETDSGESAVSSDDSISVEAATNAILSEEEEIKAREEHLKMEEEYKPFGVTYSEKEDQWYFNSEKVRYFRDILTSNGESLASGKFHGSMRTMSGNGTVDIYTVRDFEKPDKDGVGKLTGIKAFEQGEINPDAVLTEN